MKLFKQHSWFKQLLVDLFFIFSVFYIMCYSVRSIMCYSVRSIISHSVRTILSDSVFFLVGNSFWYFLFGLFPSFHNGIRERALCLLFQYLSDPQNGRVSTVNIYTHLVFTQNYWYVNSITKFLSISFSIFVTWHSLHDHLTDCSGQRQWTA